MALEIYSFAQPDQRFHALLKKSIVMLKFHGPKANMLHDIITQDYLSYHAPYSSTLELSSTGQIGEISGKRLGDQNVQPIPTTQRDDFS